MWRSKMDHEYIVYVVRGNRIYTFYSLEHRHAPLTSPNIANIAYHYGYLVAESRQLGDLIDEFFAFDGLVSCYLFSAHTH